MRTIGIRCFADHCSAVTGLRHTSRDSYPGRVILLRDFYELILRKQCQDYEFGYLSGFRSECSQTGKSIPEQKIVYAPLRVPPHPTRSKQNAKYTALLIRFDPEVKRLSLWLLCKVEVSISTKKCTNFANFH